MKDWHWICRGVSYAGAAQDFDLSVWMSSTQDALFNPDGTKLFVLGGAVFEFNLTTPFDVSSAQYSAFYPIDIEGGLLRDMAFNNDGTQLFILDDNNANVISLMLASAYDISTIIDNANPPAFSVGNEEPEPKALAFNELGTKMFILGFDRDTVFTYSFDQAYDLSSATYDGNTSALSLASFGNAFSDLDFDKNGTTLFITTRFDEVEVFHLTSPYDVSSATYAGESATLDLQEGGPGGHAILLTSLGSKLYSITRFGSNKSTIYEYTIPVLQNVEENSLASVLNIDANDGRGGPNDTSVTYRLEGPDATLFSLGTDGIINFRSVPNFDRPIDSNEDSAYELAVIATNAYEQAELRITVQVTDVTDEPVFTDVGQGFDVSKGDYLPSEERLRVNNQENDSSGADIRQHWDKAFHRWIYGQFGGRISPDHSL